MDRGRPSTEPLAAPGGLVELSVTIAATPAEVWRALTDPERTEQWMGGFRMMSTWAIGSPFVITGRLNGKPYSKTGAVLEFEPQKLLRYDHWSPLWGMPDAPANRARMSIQLEPDGDATRVSLRHELPPVEAIAPHSRFFWSVALEQLRRVLEAPSSRATSF